MRISNFKLKRLNNEKKMLNDTIDLRLELIRSMERAATEIMPGDGELKKIHEIKLERMKKELLEVIEKRNSVDSELMNYVLECEKE